MLNNGWTLLNGLMIGKKSVQFSMVSIIILGEVKPLQKSHPNPSAEDSSQIECLFSIFVFSYKINFYMMLLLKSNLMYPHFY